MKTSFKKLPQWSYPLIAAAFWVGLWWLIAALYAKPLILPTPIGMLRALWTLLKTGEFYLTVALSLGRILLGIALAFVLGILLAILTVKSAFFHHLFSPLLSLFKATPVASIIFLMLLWIGRAHIPFVIAFMMALPIVWANVREGLLQTDRQLLEMARVFGVSPRRTLIKIRLPSLSPYLLAAVRSGVSLAWKAGIAAEVLCTPKLSIGRAIYEGKLYIMTEELFAWTFIVVAISIAIEQIALHLLSKADTVRAGTAAQEKEVDK